MLLPREGPLTSTTLVDTSSSAAMIGNLLGTLGFTSASTANPAYSSPASGGAKTDTLVVTDSSDVQWSITMNSGNYGEMMNRVYSRTNQVLPTENRQWTSVSGGITLTRVILNDYSDANVVVRTNIDITRTKVIELTLFERAWRRVRVLAAAGLGMAMPEPVYAREVSGECVISAFKFVGSLLAWGLASAGVVAAGSATVASGGAGAPSVPLALTAYCGATAMLTGSSLDAGMKCFGSGGGGKKVTTGKT